MAARSLGSIGNLKIKLLGKGKAMLSWRKYIRYIRCLNDDPVAKLGLNGVFHQTTCDHER
jgi:hypothetical protein